MKQVMLIIGVLSLMMFATISFAESQYPTVVGPVMQNRYVAPTPQEEDVQPPETVKKLLDQGAIQAAEQSRLDEQQVLPVQKRK